MRIVMTATIALAVGGCASVPTAPYVAPHVTIAGMTTEAAKLELVQICVAGGAVVEQNTPNQLTCTKPMDDSFKSLLFRALTTPKYSTNPVGTVRYSFVEAGGKLFVTADMFLEYQTAFGQTNRTPITNENLLGQRQMVLDQLKAKHEASAVQSGATSQRPTQTPACESCSKIGLP